MNRFLLCVTVLCGSSCASSAYGVVVTTLNPVSDRDAGADNVLRPESNTGMIVAATGWSNSPWRLAMEFDLSTIDRSSAVLQATLTVHMAIAVVSGANNFVIHGYAGDGSVTLADLSVVNPLTPTLPYTATSSPIDVTSYLASLPPTVTHVGFRFETVSAANGFAIYSAESAYPPQLKISVPEPSTAVLCSIAAAALLSKVIRRSKRVLRTRSQRAC